MSPPDPSSLLPSERAMASLDVPQAGPAVVSAIIGRYRLLVQELIPDPIQEDNLTSQDGIVTPVVERAFAQAAGDWPQVGPFALVETSRDFRRLSRTLGGSELASQRATVAEVLARRLAARAERAWRLALKDRRGALAALLAGRQGTQTQTQTQAQAQQQQKQLMQDSPWEMDAAHLSLTRKYQRFRPDDDDDNYDTSGTGTTGWKERTEPASTLEAAVDGDCLLFLASPEVQGCVRALWTGHLVKSYTASGEVKILPYHETYEQLPPRAGAWDWTQFCMRHFNPARLSTPMYRYYLSIFLWLVFLVLYTLSMRAVKEFDIWECSLWVFALGFLLEDIVRWFKLGGLDKVDFWVIVDLLTDSLFIVSFVCRAAGFSFPPGSPRQELWQLRAFQFLACLAPLIWFQLLRVADNVQFFGIVEVIIFAMLKQTAIFFVLLVITAVGFAQALYGLDMADGQQVPDLFGKLANSLTQSVLGDPDYDLVAEAFGYPFGRILVRGRAR